MSTVLTSKLDRLTLNWTPLLGCLELADMADIGWVGKGPSF